LPHKNPRHLTCALRIYSRGIQIFNSFLCKVQRGEKVNQMGKVKVPLHPLNYYLSAHIPMEFLRTLCYAGSQIKTILAQNTEQMQIIAATNKI